MVKIGMRMFKLRSLLGIKLGPGAAILPPEITKLHMDFATDIHDGHYGPRKFWRHCLPRLKFHNPAVSMTVNRTHDQEGPALLSVYYTSTTSKQQSSAPVNSSTSVPPTTRVEQINMKHRTESEILEQLLKLTEAKVVKATPEELKEMAEIDEKNRKMEADAIKSAQLLEVKKREKMLLQQAAGMLS